MTVNKSVIVVGQVILGRATFGMQTVAFIPILPHGVVQLGSFLPIMENTRFVNDVKHLIFQLESVPGALPSEDHSTGLSKESSVLTSQSQNLNEIPEYLCQPMARRENATVKAEAEGISTNLNVFATTFMTTLNNTKPLYFSVSLCLTPVAIRCYGNSVCHTLFDIVLSVVIILIFMPNCSHWYTLSCLYCVMLALRFNFG
ncbi:hypothetical protein KIW84_050638 [Lathyrus oleraceus]|uniref:Transcription factor MYC/MYB N-terminal domain-containing protein n=1 Tax=Pisum sativum TaxID=3888 RepID=A0A9D5AEV7_PEA|nr:hypothetical protein KIW84_050638 [Pisum sativum]